MRVLFTAFLLLFLSHNVVAQLNITTGQTALQLANMIAGPGVVVSNATISGSPQAIGAFTTGANATGLGFTDGVVFGTGDVTTFGLDQLTFSSDQLGQPGIPYLATLAGITSLDGLTLEFDFVPNADLVSFDYVFGSDEHPTFSCSPSFNDIFAITVTGVTVVQPENLITLIPGTTTPVSISTVNNQGCGDPTYYVDNTVQNSQYIVFGGYTTVLTAEMIVQCGEMYHLKMMISDGGDESYNTGCFVKANSLTTGSVTINTTTASADNSTVEGCSNAVVTLTLNGQPFATDFPVPIWISNASALWGVDYQPIGALNLADSTIIMPANSNTVSFTIDPINDNLAEGIEFIEFIVVTSTCGLTDTFQVLIEDMVPISINTSNDTTICVGNAVVWAQGDGGGGAYTYNWANNLGVNDTILPSPAVTTTYTVTVGDQCGSTPAQATVTVTVDDGPSANAGFDVGVCSAGGFLYLNGSTDTPGAVFSWSPPTFLSATNVPNPMCTPTAATEYVLTVTRNDGCYQRDTVMVNITAPPTSAFTIPNAACVGEPMVVNYTGNADPSGQFNWQFQNGQVVFGSGIGPLSVLWNGPGIFDVSLTVAWNGCVSPTTTLQVEMVAPPVPFAGVDVSFCPGESAQLGSPAQPGEIHSWTPSTGLSATNVAQPNVSLGNLSHQAQISTYYLTVTNLACSTVDSVRVIVYPTPTAEFEVPVGECFTTNAFDLEANGFFGAGATFDWQFGTTAFPQQSNAATVSGLIFNAPGTFPVTLVVTDNNCVSQPFVGNLQVFDMPTADFATTDLEGCQPHGARFINQSNGPSSVLYSTWAFGDVTGSDERDPYHTYTDTGFFSVTLLVETPEGCGDSITKPSYINVHPKPNAEFNLNSETLSFFDPTVEVTSTALGIQTSQFTFVGEGVDITALSAEHTYLDTGNYFIRQIVTTQYGCADTTLREVRIDPQFTIYIPNSFSPNGDGINEVFQAQGEYVYDFHMVVYDRWGMVLFECWDMNDAWDGSKNGSQVQQGDYIYRVFVNDILGEPHLFDGNLRLFR
jgi:gliding motility-associated-like protein